jgi:hypothetical protein
VGYYGQRNVKQHGSYDLNNVEPSPGALQPKRPYQPYAAISVANVNMFQNTANQLQAGIQRRYAGGLLLNAEYQYIRDIGTESFIDPGNWSDSRGNLNGIRRHVLVVSYVYDLPFGKGRKFFGGVTRNMDRLIGGWQLAGITQALSGSPFTPTFTTSVVGALGGRPNTVVGQELYPSDRSLNRYFNPTAFAVPADFKWGTASYNMLWGPGQQNWDASLVKNLHLTERALLQVRMEAFSAFNHPIFANPAAVITNTSTVGRISSSTGERTVQLGAKILF